MKIETFKDGKSGCKCIECDKEKPLHRISFGNGLVALYLCNGCRKALRFACETDSHERHTEVMADLRRIDKASFDVTEWESTFLESILSGTNRSGGAKLTERQLEAAERMINKYRKQLD